MRLTRAEEPERARADDPERAPVAASKPLIPASFVSEVCARLVANKRVRRALPIWGRIHVDRQLPFLCVYRRPPNGRAGGTDQLVSSEAAYVVSSGARRVQKPLARLVQAVCETLAEPFGAMLLLEIWEGDFDDGEDEDRASHPDMATPRFRIVVSEEDETAPHVHALRRALSDVRIAKERVYVEVVRRDRCTPPGFPSLVSEPAARKFGGSVLGLEVRPVYRQAETGEIYPLLHRNVQRALTRALRRGFHEFSCTRTTHCPVHYHMLGRQAVVKAVWDVDRRLAEVSNDYDLLLQVSPVNVDQAWKEFRGDRFERGPTFRYRPLRADPVILKRRLFQVPIERVEDPVLHELFREKQDELDRQITLLLELDTPRFAPAGVMLYGRPSADDIRSAREILDRVPPRSRDEAGAKLDTASLVRLAEAEIAYYREQWPQFKASVRVRGDLSGGLMVSRGSLLVSRTARVPAARAEALLQHEIGTHIVTYYNGRAQPFRQLYSGLAGYEPLQEGLAVLSEYLVGGLSRPRLRLLAARVVAVQAMLEGATFVDTFRTLDRDCDFSQRTAFQVTMRVYRGGGLAKDAIYLRGLAELLDHLAGGGALEPLLVGKMALVHLPVIRELQWREILNPAPLRPRYLDAPGAAERLARVRAGVTLMDLVDRPARPRKGTRRK